MRTSSPYCVGRAMVDGRALLLAALCACGAQSPAFHDLEDQLHHPLAVENAAVHVLLFLTVDCPIANGYAPTIKELAGEFEPLGVTFFLIHVDPDVDASGAREHAADFGYDLPVLLDPEHLLVEQLGATITPEAAVLTAQEGLVYRGRIDDWYAALGKKRRQPTTHDLRETLKACLAGSPVPVARTEAVGCMIPESLIRADNS